MPNTREKLIELLLESKEAINEICENTRYKNCQYEKYGFNCGWAVKADHLIANGVTVQQWIPVTERLPEYGQLVIVYSGGVLSPQVYAQHFWRADFNDWVHITHWMPLPEPPKGD